MAKEQTRHRDGDHDDRPKGKYGVVGEGCALAGILWLDQLVAASLATATTSSRPPGIVLLAPQKGRTDARFLEFAVRWPERAIPVLCRRPPRTQNRSIPNMKNSTTVATTEISRNKSNLVRKKSTWRFLRASPVN